MTETVLTYVIIQTVRGSFCKTDAPTTGIDDTVPIVFLVY